MDLSTLPPIRYAGRADAIRRDMESHGIDGLLVTNLTNLRWLTGFTGSAGVAVVLADRIVLVTDGRYASRAEAELGAACVDADIRIGFTQPEQRQLVVDALHGVARVGAEAESMTHHTWEAYATELPLEPAEGLIEDARRVKDAGEVARIAAACRCAGAALSDVVPMLARRPREAEVRTELEYLMRRHGADGPSYDTIVASGPDFAARPHHQVGERTIDEGDTVVIDVGALVDGYHSDMTRSFVVGEPSAEQQRVYDLLLEVQLAGLAAVGAGVAARDVDATCRSMISRAGFGDWFLHSTGHGVGLMIHEDPFESPTSKSELRAGDVVTVEPGLYRVGFGGFRIEDLVEVTEAGCRILTEFPKDSPCLPSPPTT
jgi:Xaa-Pro aminopeptidase